MDLHRRTFLAGASAVLAGAASGSADPAVAQGPAGQSAARQHFRRIATEEAFATPELAEAWRETVRNAQNSNLDVPFIRSIFDNPVPGSIRDEFRRRLLDIEDERLRLMDDAGVDMHVLSVTIPGVQMFDADRAVEFARRTNDQLAAAISRHPRRLAGLACFAPQSPAHSAREMERSVRDLHLNGFIVNSHTNNEYLDDPKFWPIFEAAEALDRPIYLHPRSPSDGMAEPFRQYNLAGSIWGYAAEAGTHAVRLMLSGVFDRFPRLKIVLGHMGEAIPFWLWRIDFMQARRTSEGMARRLQLTPNEYFRRNFAITTSGVESHDVLDFVLRVVGEDNVMWAIDYPYQPSRPAVAFMDSAPVSPATKAKLYHRNAERIFHIA
jgi:predicted TIM-barrel fold metal-dependent hydrolase